MRCDVVYPDHCTRGATSADQHFQRLPGHLRIPGRLNLALLSWTTASRRPFHPLGNRIVHRERRRIRPRRILEREQTGVLHFLEQADGFRNPIPFRPKAHDDVRSDGNRLFARASRLSFQISSRE